MVRWCSVLSRSLPAVISQNDFWGRIINVLDTEFSHIRTNFRTQIDETRLEDIGEQLGYNIINNNIPTLLQNFWFSRYKGTALSYFLASPYTDTKLLRLFSNIGSSTPISITIGTNFSNESIPNRFDSSPPGSFDDFPIISLDSERTELEVITRLLVLVNYTHAEKDTLIAMQQNLNRVRSVRDVVNAGVYFNLDADDSANDSILVEYLSE